MPRQKKYKENVAEGERVSPNAVYDYLIQKGVPHKHALGMLANIKHESNFIPTSKGDGGTSAGLFMHHNDRYNGLKKHVNNDLRDWKGQIDYALQEADTRNYLKRSFKSPEEASHWFTTKWERPENADKKAVQRQTYIKTFLDNRGQDYKQRLHNPDGIDPSEDLASTYDEDVNKTAYADMIPEEEKKKVAFKKDYDVEKTIEEKTDDSEARQELTAQEKEHLAKTNFVNDFTELLNPTPDNQDTDNTDTPTYQPQDHTYLADQRDAFQPIQSAQQLFSIPQAMNGGYFDDQSIVLRDGGEVSNYITNYGPEENHADYIKSKWSEPNYKFDSDGTYYDPMTQTIHISPEDKNDKAKIEHEKMHHWQNLHNALRDHSSTPIMKKPHPLEDQNFEGNHYYDRRDKEAEYTRQDFLNAYPEFKLIPNQVLTDKVVDPSMYNDPFSVEGEGRNYEEYINNGGTPIFEAPQQRFGGLAPMPRVGGHNDDSMI